MMNRDPWWWPMMEPPLPSPEGLSREYDAVFLQREFRELYLHGRITLDEWLMLVNLIHHPGAEALADVDAVKIDAWLMQACLDDTITGPERERMLRYLEVFYV